MKVEEMDALPKFDIFRIDLLVRNDHSLAIKGRLNHDEICLGRN